MNGHQNEAFSYLIGALNSPRKVNGYGADYAVINPIPKIADDDDYEFERPTYGRYAGSYAQDEAGYSDDDIDTIFEGDPSAYWNID